MQLAAPAAAVTDFSQVATRFRRGVRLLSADPAEARFAAAVKAAIAPHAPATSPAPALIVAGPVPPKDMLPPLRFDLGPVELRRSDGPLLYSSRDLSRMTVVQLLRGGSRPVIWIRPGEGGVLPRALDLNEGDVALFEENGRAMAFSTRRDRAVRIQYGEGADAYGGDRTLANWRTGLLILWLLITAGVAVILVRLPVPKRSEAV